MQLFTATFVKNKCKFLRFLVQQKLALLISNPISEEELYAIVNTMATNKAPGPDGISIEFYQRYWQTIKQDFTEMINEIHASGEIPEKMKLGTIKLIHKKGPKTDIRNYRPITLLNVDFKIYTKCLIKRITPALGGLPSPNQFAAPGKSKPRLSRATCTSTRTKRKWTSSW